MNSKNGNEVDLEELSRRLDVPLETLRTFAYISDPANRHLFSAEAARKAFAGVPLRDLQFDELSTSDASALRTLEGVDSPDPQHPWPSPAIKRPG